MNSLSGSSFCSQMESDQAWASSLSMRIKRCFGAVSSGDEISGEGPWRRAIYDGLGELPCGDEAFLCEVRFRALACMRASKPARQPDSGPESV